MQERICDPRFRLIGRFLEVSLHAPDILESIAFWEALGFRQVSTNDVWNHPYAVLSDGRILLGLHAYRFDHSPALTFVRQDLAKYLPPLRAMGIEFEFAKTESDQFHEAGFLSPDGQMVTLLESRTYSPPMFDEEDFSVLGRLDALHLPVRRVDEALPFWARLGLSVLEFDEDRPESALLFSGPLSLRLREDRALRVPTLTYAALELDAVAETLSNRVGDPQRSRDGALELVSLEGLPIHIKVGADL